MVPVEAQVAFVEREVLDLYLLYFLGNLGGKNHAMVCEIKDSRMKLVVSHY